MSFEAPRMFEAQRIENQRGIFQHNLMAFVWVARDYFKSDLTPEGGFENIKRRFLENSKGIARIEVFTEERGIRKSISQFFKNAEKGDWNNKEVVFGLDQEGDKIIGNFQNYKGYLLSGNFK